MTTVITYLWGRKYQPAHVQVLARSVAYWLREPHRFLCVSDQAVPGVETMRDPAARYSRRCYRRLWLFSDQARTLGETVLHLDLDVVVCGDLAPLLRPDDFVIYRAPSVAARGWSLNPSVFWLRTGTQTDLWTRFVADPRRLARQANDDGFWGSDQAIISHLRKEATLPTFGDADGVVSFRRIRAEQLTRPPDGTCLVSFHGRRTPFEREVQAAHPWIRDAFRQAA